MNDPTIFYITEHHTQCCFFKVLFLQIVKLNHDDNKKDDCDDVECQTKHSYLHFSGFLQCYDTLIEEMWMTISVYDICLQRINCPLFFLMFNSHKIFPTHVPRRKNETGDHSFFDIS